MQISTEEKFLAIVSHISFFLGGMGFLVVPLVIYLLKKEDPFIRHHARQALVAHLVLLVLSVVVGLTCFFLIGIILIPILLILGLLLVVTSLIASYKALKGELYEYPFIQPIVALLD